MAMKAAAIALCICVLFALAGAKFLDIMGISLSSFRIAGGTLLFLISLEMVFARTSGTKSTTPEKEEAKNREDISVFPLAFPFIAGPGALATILLEAGETSNSHLLFAGFLGVVALVLVICWALMLATPRLMNVLGVTGANVMSRLSGVILAALAVQFIIDGIRGSFLTS
jgi:multiple antibiotic resistance protein